jgi:hypothetical protein
VTSNTEVAFLLVAAMIGAVVAATVVVVLIALAVGLVASCVGALMAGAARSLTVTRPYAVSTPARAMPAAQARASSGTPAQPDGEWLDSWFEDPQGAPPKWEYARRPARSPRRPRRSPASLHRVRVAATGALRVAVARGHRVLTGPREWLQPGMARPATASSRTPSSWMFRLGDGAASPRTRNPARSGAWWRAPATFGYPGKRESEAILPARRVPTSAAPGIADARDDHRRGSAA